MGYSYGLTGELLYGTAGDNADTVIAKVRDVLLNGTGIEADTTNRSSGGFASSKVILDEVVLTFDLQVDEADADGAILALKNAWINRTPIALWAKNKTGGEGINGDFGITNFSRNEQLRDVMVFNVEAKPNNEIREPVWE